MIVLNHTKRNLPADFFFVNTLWCLAVLIKFANLINKRIINYNL